MRYCISTTKSVPLGVVSLDMPSLVMASDDPGVSIPAMRVRISFGISIRPSASCAVAAIGAVAVSTTSSTGLFFFFATFEPYAALSPDPFLSVTASQRVWVASGSKCMAVNICDPSGVFPPEILTGMSNTGLKS